VQQRNRVLKVARDGTGMRDEADPLSGDRRRIVEQVLEADADRYGSLRFGGSVVCSTGRPLRRSRA
jgi:hypothetical protein